MIQQEVETKNKQQKQHIQTAQEIRKKSLERSSKTKKRGELETSLDKTPKKNQNNEFDTENYLRGKLEVRR